MHARYGDQQHVPLDPADLPVVLPLEVGPVAVARLELSLECCIDKRLKGSNLWRYLSIFGHKMPICDKNLGKRRVMGRPNPRWVAMVHHRGKAGINGLSSMKSDHNDAHGKQHGHGARVPESGRSTAAEDKFVLAAIGGAGHD